ncbi:MAG: preprotein translocase subunit SecG [Candidatus Omnitrophota bacterium]
MFGLILGVHVLVCMLLVLVILMQAGKGGGLTDTFSAAESVFGTKTNIVMVKATAILASIFLVTSLSLTFLASQKNKSLVQNSVVSSSPATAVPAAASGPNSNSVSDTQKPQENANAENQQAPQPASPEAPKNP